MEIFLVRVTYPTGPRDASGQLPPGMPDVPITRYLNAAGSWSRDRDLAAPFPNKDEAKVARAAVLTSSSPGPGSLSRRCALGAKIVRVRRKAKASAPPVDLDDAWVAAEARLDVDVGYFLAVVRLPEPGAGWVAYEMSTRPESWSPDGTPDCRPRLGKEPIGQGATLPDLLASLGQPTTPAQETTHADR